ncbi:E3 ubiquitin-protein ligase TTC3-like isoform X2 [Ictidomys tridecemlineatus]
MMMTAPAPALAVQIQTSKTLLLQSLKIMKKEPSATQWKKSTKLSSKTTAKLSTSAKRAYIPRNLSAPAFSTSLNFVETERDLKNTNYKMANGGNQNLKVVDEALKVDDCDSHPEFLPPPRFSTRNLSYP